MGTSVAAGQTSTLFSPTPPTFQTCASSNPLHRLLRLVLSRMMVSQWKCTSKTLCWSWGWGGSAVQTSCSIVLCSAGVECRLVWSVCATQSAPAWHADRLISYCGITSIFKEEHATCKARAKSLVALWLNIILLIIMQRRREVKHKSVRVNVFTLTAR